MPYLKMLWTTESPTPQIGSWDYWITKADDRPYNKHHTIKKVNNKICYYGSFIRDNPLDRDTLVISPDSDAVTMCHWHGTPVYTYTGTITDSNGIIWYYTHIPADLYNPSGESMIYDISSKRYGSNTQQAAQDLLDRIYAVPFYEDYQAGQYILNRADKGRTVRKVLGLWLAFTVSNYSSPNVQYISDNADTIINDIVTKLSASTDFRIYMYARYNNVGRGVYINVYYGNNVSGITASIIQKSIYRGLEYYAIGATTPQSPFTNLYSLYVNYGTPTTTETTGTYYFQTIGIYSTNLYDKDITNMGIDL